MAIVRGLNIPDYLAVAAEKFLAAAGQGRNEVDALPLWNIVDDAFHDRRYDNSEDEVGALRLSVERGEVVLRRIDLPREEDCASEDPHHHARFSGGEEHRRICSVAARWLTSRGREWSCLQWHLDCPGGKADIVTLDGELTVEVGHTRADKIVKCLVRGLEVLMVPYITMGRFGVLLRYERDLRVSTLRS